MTKFLEDLGNKPDWKWIFVILGYIGLVLPTPVSYIVAFICLVTSLIFYGGEENGVL